ncbi:MAG: hypothetical protein K2H21_00775 [Muribaculaceae bacterium]|nr:hypothetical protein [Muribaculaceae bacterium]
MKHFYLLLTLMAMLVPSLAKADVTVQMDTNDPVASYVLFVNGYDAKRYDWASDGTMTLTLPDGKGFNVNVNSGYVINSISLDGEEIAKDLTSNYYVEPSRLYDGCSVSVRASERPKTNVTIVGDPSQITVTYMYQTYDASSWNAGTLQLTLQDAYSSVTISARDGFGLQAVNVNGNNELQPGSHYFTLYPSTLRSGDNRVEVVSYSMAAERNQRFLVNVNGDPAAVSLRLAGDSRDMTGSELLAPIAFNPEFDLPIRIEPYIYGHTLYRVMADGVEIIPSDGTYKVTQLADNGVITIDVDYPDKDIPVRFSFVNPDTEGAVLKVADTQFTIIPREQWLAPDFTVKMGTVVRVELDAANYTVSADFNGNRVDGAYLEFVATDDAGYDIEVTAEPLEPYDVTFYYEALPAHFRVLRGNLDDDYVEMTGRDETVVKVARNLNRLRIVPDEGWLITYVFVDGVQATTDFTVSGNTTVEVYVEEYARDRYASIYLDPAMGWYYGGVTLSVDDASKMMTVDLVPGYNMVGFNPADLPLQFELRCAATEYYSYFDNMVNFDHQVLGPYDTSEIHMVDNVDHGAIFKFFAAEPEMCDVRFSYEEGVDVSVMHDMISEVGTPDSLELPVSTVVTVTPAPSTEISVKAGGRDIVADAEGRFHVAIEESCEIEVVKGTESGVSEISGAATADVYSLQGILLHKGADAATLRAMPKGCYIVGGRKIRIK